MGPEGYGRVEMKTEHKRLRESWCERGRHLDTVEGSEPLDHLSPGATAQIPADRDGGEKQGSVCVCV